MDELLTTYEVFKLLRIDRVTVRRMVQRGDLPCIRINSRGDMRFRREDVDAILNGDKFGTQTKI